MKLLDDCLNVLNYINEIGMWAFWTRESLWG